MTEDSSESSTRPYGAMDEELISPYMTSICGPLRVLDASMECHHRRDGTYSYVYSLRAEVKQKEEEPKTEVSFVVRDGSQQRQTAEFSPDTQLKEILRYFVAGRHAIQTRIALLVDGDRRSSIPIEAPMVHKTLKELLPPGGHSLTILVDHSQPVPTPFSS